MSKIDKYINFENLSNEEAKKRLEEAPEVCPITGLLKIESYWFDEGIVYGYPRPDIQDHMMHIHCLLTMKKRKNFQE